MICGSSSSAREIRGAGLIYPFHLPYKLSWCHNFLKLYRSKTLSKNVFLLRALRPFKRKKSLQVLVCTVVVWSNWIRLAPFSHFLWFSSLADPHKCEKVRGETGVCGRETEFVQEEERNDEGLHISFISGFSRKSFMEQIHFIICAILYVWSWSCITYQKVKGQKNRFVYCGVENTIAKKKKSRNLPLHCVKRGKGVRFFPGEEWLPPSILNPNKNRLCSKTWRPKEVKFENVFKNTSLRAPRNLDREWISQPRILQTSPPPTPSATTTLTVLWPDGFATGKKGKRREGGEKTKAIPQFSWKRRRMSIEQHTCAFLPLLLFRDPLNAHSHMQAKKTSLQLCCILSQIIFGAL